MPRKGKPVLEPRPTRWGYYAIAGMFLLLAILFAVKLALPDPEPLVMPKFEDRVEPDVPPKVDQIPDKRICVDSAGRRYKCNYGGETR